MMPWRTVAAVILAALLWAGNPTAARGQTKLTRDQVLEAGRVATRQQHYPEAIHLLEDGLKRFPRDQEIKAELGRAYLFDRQDDRAIRLLKEVLSEEPSNRTAKLQMARALGYHQDYEASNQLFRELLKANPHDEAASLGLIRNLMHENRTTEARRELDLALTRHPQSKFLKEYKQRIDKGRKLSGMQRDRTAPEPAGGRKANRVQGSELYLTDSAGNRYLRSGQLFDYEIGHGLLNRFQTEERSLWSRTLPTANVFSMNDELRYRVAPFLLVGAGVGGARFGDGQSCALYRGELELHPLKRLWLTGGFSRIPIYPTVRAAQFDLHAEGWSTYLEWDPGKWRTSAWWSGLRYSDGNRAQRKGAELLRWFGTSQLAFAAGYRLSHINFSQTLPHGYFDPDRYQSHLGVTGARFRIGRMFTAEYLVRGGGEAVSALPYRGVWELDFRNRVRWENWEFNGDYFHYHLTQDTGAFKAQAFRFGATYHF